MTHLKMEVQFCLWKERVRAEDGRKVSLYRWLLVNTHKDKWHADGWAPTVEAAKEAAGAHAKANGLTIIIREHNGEKMGAPIPGSVRQTYYTSGINGKRWSAPAKE